LQSPSAILYDRVTSNVAEADPEAAEPSLLDASSPAPSPQAGVALEARWPSTDPSERLPVYPKAPLKGAASGRSGRVARFAREALKTVATPAAPVLCEVAEVLPALCLHLLTCAIGGVSGAVCALAGVGPDHWKSRDRSTNQYVTRRRCSTSIDPFDFRWR